jgi:lysophospholipase L1-like esterase
MSQQTGHIVLLGDSIFDNGAYVGGGPDVVAQLRSRLPQGWEATLLAVDGAVTADVPRQLGGIPVGATHLVVSAGGNDALGASGILAEKASSVSSAVQRLAEARDRIRKAYENMLGAVLERQLPTALCTIYDANYPEPQAKVITAALTLFNDVITRSAFKRGLPLIDLRLICDRPDDYANPIEPSEKGGDKIARAIAQVIQAPATAPHSIVIASP